jgi:3'-phosphoadenosine 5'-phosphosulfate sulfotransferase (PAPS reductase)/FAD synthetase
MELESVRRLVQERGSDLAFVVNHSGGKDSTRMLGFVRNKFRDSPTYVAMADTGFEHQRPISAADFARQRCAEFGLNLTVVRNPKRTYLEMVERRGMFPSPRFRQCTSDLKRSPVEKFTHDVLQQIGVTLLFAAMVGSLTRMWFLTLTSRPR